MSPDPVPYPLSKIRLGKFHLSAKMTRLRIIKLVPDWFAARGRKSHVRFLHSYLAPPPFPFLSLLCGCIISSSIYARVYVTADISSYSHSRNSFTSKSIKAQDGDKSFLTNSESIIRFLHMYTYMCEMVRHCWKKINSSTHIRPHYRRNTSKNGTIKFCNLIIEFIGAGRHFSFVGRTSRF